MLSRDEVLKIARLARLSLTEDEVVTYQKNLGRVLEYITELNQVQTPDPSFVKHVPEDAISLREDVASSFQNVETLLGNAPERESNSFVLPTVVDHA